MIWLELATELDEFLEGAGAGTRFGEQLATVGTLIALPATVVALGALVFILAVHDGGIAELRAIWRLEAICGVLLMVGGLVGVYGAALILGSDWTGELLGGTARAPSLRTAGGISMAVGFAAGSHSERTGLHGALWIGVVGLAICATAVVSTGHTVTQGNLLLHVAMNVIHLTAAAIWVGGLVSLILMARIRSRQPNAGSMAPQVVRFSGVATLAIVAVAAAGIGMSLTIVDGLGDYLGTAWGRILLVKVALVGGAVGIGAYNHFVVVPALETDPAHPIYLPRSRSTITAEVVILLAVAVITGFLTDTPIN